MWRKLLVTMLAAGAAACAATSVRPSAQHAELDPALVADGRDIAEAQCARCHSVGPYGQSPMQGAPVFREVLSLYPADVLEQELVEGIRVAHPMPDFQFNPQGVDALIVYLKSIQTPEPATRRG